MSLRVWSKRLYGPATVTLAAPVICFTVPAGHTYIVREILAFNSSTGSLPTIRVGIGSLATNANRIFQLPLPQPGTLRQEMRLVVNPGETFRATAVDAEVSSLTVNGYDLVS